MVLCHVIKIIIIINDYDNSVSCLRVKYNLRVIMTVLYNVINIILYDSYTKNIKNTGPIVEVIDKHEYQQPQSADDASKNINIQYLSFVNTKYSKYKTGFINISRGYFQKWWQMIQSMQQKQLPEKAMAVVFTEVVGLGGAVILE